MNKEITIEDKLIERKAARLIIEYAMEALEAKKAYEEEQKQKERSNA